jgi:phosphoribosylformylglycinamidine cyclo-ligase
VADVLLRVHRSYLKPLWPMIERGEVKGLAHITGGGLIDNVPRVLPKDVDARFDLSSWKVPNVFRVLQAEGGVERDEMFRAFNMGVGMVAAVAAEGADAAVAELNAAGERAWICGEATPGSGRTALA